MKDRLDAESEERERLEQFLKWRHAVGRNRKATDRRVPVFVVGALFGVVAGGLIVTLIGTSLNTSTRRASERTATPANNVATTLSRATPPSVPSNSPAGGSASIEPPGPVREAEAVAVRGAPQRDRKSTRLNSSHLGISYAVFCLKKKNKT